MDKSNTKPNPTAKPPLAKNEGSQSRKNWFKYRSVILSLDLLTNSTRHKAKFAVRQCAQFSTEYKLMRDQYVKRVLKYLKVTAMQDLILKTDPEKGIKCYIDAGFTGG